MAHASAREGIAALLYYCHTIRDMLLYGTEDENSDSVVGTGERRA